MTTLDIQLLGIVRTVKLLMFTGKIKHTNLLWLARTVKYGKT